MILFNCIVFQNCTRNCCYMVRHCQKINQVLLVVTDQAVYCNGVKCETYEKCMYDRVTRREKCTRA